MRLVLLARKGSPVVHYAGLANHYADAFCGQMSLTAVDHHRTPALTDPWWWGTPAQAHDARLLERRRICASCIRVFDDWAIEVDQALARQAEREDQP